MSLKAVILISSCLFSLALASGEIKVSNDGSPDLKIQNLLKSVAEKINAGSSYLGPVVNQISDESLDLRSKFIASLASRVSPRVTIDGSNLPALTQVAVADCLKLAYEYHETDAERIELFVDLLTEVVPSYQWNVVLDYQHLYYTANYWIRLKTDDGDLVFAFTSNN